MSIRRVAPFVIAAVVASVSAATPVSAGGGGGGCVAGGFSDASSTEVVLSEMCFNPTVTRIGVGDTVTFVNKDPVPHAVGGVANVFGDVHTQIGTGKSGTLSYRFDRPGVFPYVCIFHPGMAGAIVVGDGVPEGDASTAAGKAVDAPTGKGDASGAVQPASDPAGTSAAAVGAGAAVLLAALLLFLSRRPRPAIRT